MRLIVPLTLLALAACAPQPALETQIDANPPPPEVVPIVEPIGAA